MEYAIRTRNLTKDFGAFRLENVNLELPGGAILGLIGENGAGKSTLIKCILGILLPDSGDVELLGGPPADALDKAGYVPDECPFAPALRVRQVGNMLAGMHPGWDSTLFDHYIQTFQLPAGQKVKELSRGMGMKLSIAAALSHHPNILVLDEATSGLDPVVRDEILDEFLNFLADEEHAILLSSHITSDLEKACDYITYLHDGRVTLSGAKDELLACYGKTACTRAELDRIDPALLAGKREGMYGCQALVRDREAVRRACPGLAVDPASLEDIMIFMTRGNQM